MNRTGWMVALLAGLATPAQAEVRYVHTDALGSVVAKTDENGNVIERREYEPYGRQLTPAPLQDGPGYTGHVQDAATGLTYMQQRYYDSAIGMFLSVDPVMADGDRIEQFHRYRYANNNPYMFTDPDGRQSLPEHMVLPSGIDANSQVPRSEAAARAYGTAPAVPFNKKQFASDMDEMSDKANVAQLGAMATGLTPAAVIAGVVATAADVAAFAAEPTLERGVEIATAGALKGASKAAKYLENHTAREAVETAAEGTDNGKMIIDATDTVRGPPEDHEIERRNQ